MRGENGKLDKTVNRWSTDRELSRECDIPD